MNLSSKQHSQKMGVHSLMKNTNTRIFLTLVFVLFASLFSGLMITHFGVYGVFAIIGIIISFVVFLDSYIGLFVIIIAFPFLVGFSRGIDAGEVVFMLVFGLWILGWLTRLLLGYPRNFGFAWHPIYKPTLAIGAMLLIGAVIGLLNGVSFVNVFRDLSRYVGYLVLIPVASIVRTRKQIWRLLIILVMVGLPCYVWSSFVWSERKFGLEYGSMNIAGVGSAYFSFFIASLWPLLLLNTGKRMRILAALGLVLELLYALGSGYRHQILGFFVMTCLAIWGVWVMHTGKQKMKFIVPFAIGTLFLFWVIYGTLGYMPLPGGDRVRVYYMRMFPQALSQDSSFKGRVLQSQAELRVFRKHPLVGQGLGRGVGFEWKFGSWLESYGSHIWMTEILRKFGIAGAFVFIWYILSISRFTFKIFKKPNNPIIRAIALGTFIWVLTNSVPTVGAFITRGFTLMMGLIIGVLPSLAGWRQFDVKNMEAEKSLKTGPRKL